jgi:hypothetical protein
MKFLRNMRQLIRFMQLPAQDKSIVVYSEGKAYWVHLESLVRELLDNTEVGLCYISSGEDDPGLDLMHPRFTALRTDEGWIRNWLFENLDCRMLIMSMPDLDTYQIKRSDKPVHYIYAQHSLVSMHMAYRKGAFDHFDTILCAGPYQGEEIRAMESYYDTPRKTLIEYAYSRLTSIMQSAQHGSELRSMDGKHILIAPSWGEHGLIETIGREVVDILLGGGFRVTLRPHPQTTKFSGDILIRIASAHRGNPNFVLETDVASQDSLHKSDLMISDWSGAALEYAFGLKKPVLFFDLPRKVNNPDYAMLGIEPFEVSVREKIGRVISPGELSSLNAHVSELLNEQRMGESIDEVIRENLYDSTVSDKFVIHVINILGESQQAT